MPGEDAIVPPVTTWRGAWRVAPWPLRLLLGGLCALFVFRAVYEPPQRCDLGGFIDIGAAAGAGQVLDDPVINTYPPTFTPIAGGLAALARLGGERTLRHLWGLAQLLALGFLVVAWTRLLGLAPSLGAAAFAALALWRYVVNDLNNQNLSALLCALTAAAVARAAMGQAGLAGAMLGAGAAVKILPAFPAAALLLPGATGRGRALGGFLAGLAGMVALTLLYLGPAGFLAAWRYFTEAILPVFGGGGVGNQSFTGAALRLVAAAPDTLQRVAGERTELARWLGAGLGLAVLAGLAILRLRRPPTTARARALDAALFALAGAPALPIAWSHYFLAALPVALVAAVSPSRRERGLAIAAAVVGGLFDADLLGSGLWRLAAHASHVLLAGLLFLACGLAIRSRWRAEDAASSP